MKKKTAKAVASSTSILAGVYTKKAAAIEICSGVRHLHSSVIGTRDPLYRTTQEALQNSQVARYPWEPTSRHKGFTLTDSAQRHSLIHEILGELGIESDSSLKDRTRSVLEELLTNALFHAYRNPDQTEKYSRKDAVQLLPAETIGVRFTSTKEGIALCVTDQGGSLSFDQILDAFKRCYGKNHNQIESKSGGAGLGLYLIFESVSHIKVECSPGNRNCVSVWLANKRAFDESVFSFNYFLGGKP